MTRSLHFKINSLAVSSSELTVFGKLKQTYATLLVGSQCSIPSFDLDGSFEGWHLGRAIPFVLRTRLQHLEVVVENDLINVSQISRHFRWCGFESHVRSHETCPAHWCTAFGPDTWSVTHWEGLAICPGLIMVRTGAYHMLAEASVHSLRRTSLDRHACRGQMADTVKRAKQRTSLRS